MTTILSGKKGVGFLALIKILLILGFIPATLAHADIDNLCGTPEEVARESASLTGQYLVEVLARDAEPSVAV